MINWLNKCLLKQRNVWWTVIAEVYVPVQLDVASIKARVISNTQPFPLFEELASLPVKQLEDIIRAVMEADVLRKHGKPTLVGMIIKGMFNKQKSSSGQKAAPLSKSIEEKMQMAVIKWKAHKFDKLRMNQAAVEMNYGAGSFKWHPTCKCRSDED